MLSFLSKHLTHWPQNNGSDRYLRANILGNGKIYLGNFRRVASDEVEEHSPSRRYYSKDPILSLILTFNLLEDSFAFFNQLLELYSSTFSMTTTLDLWVDPEFAGKAVTSTSGSFPALFTFHSFTNVKTLNLLGQSPLYTLPLFSSFIPCSTVITLDRNRHGRDV